METNITFTEPITLCRGTTPTLTIILPDDYPVSDLSEAEVVISCDGEVVSTKQTSDIMLVVEDNALVVNYTQEETLELSVGDASCQIRVLDNEGNASASEIVPVNVVDVLRDGVIPIEQEEQEEQEGE